MLNLGFQFYPFLFFFWVSTTSLVIPSLILQIWKIIFKFGDFQEKKKTPKFKNQVQLNPTLHMIPDVNYMILGHGTTLLLTTLAASTLIILFSKMLKFSKTDFFPNKTTTKIVKENIEFWRIFPPPFFPKMIISKSINFLKIMCWSGQSTPALVLYKLIKSN